jgi:hypothetical protein
MPLLLSYGPEGIAKVLLVRGAISCVLIAGMRRGDVAANKFSVLDEGISYPAGVHLSGFKDRATT